MSIPFDMGGNDLIVNSVTVGASAPGSSVASGISATTPTVIAPKTTIKTNVTAVTATSNIATVTNYMLQVTTPALVTASGASQTEVITLTGLTTADIAWVDWAGGTNTIPNFNLLAVCTANTLTITIFNIHGSLPLNGTLILNVWIMKA